MLVVTKRLPPDSSLRIDLTLSLTAEERRRSRYQFTLDQGNPVSLQLPRGTVLEDGDVLVLEGSNNLIRVVAKSEPVMTVTAQNGLALIRAAYHLGNRHVPLEITPSYLRFSPDPVLKNMLEQLGLKISEELTPFYPEKGAYLHHHS